MDTSVLSRLEAILQLPGSTGVVADAAVLLCGCVVSELQFLLSPAETCPVCQLSASLLKPVQPLRDLHRLWGQLAQKNRPRRRLSLRRSTKTTEKGSELDLMGLFCKYAKDDGTSVLSLLPVAIKTTKREPSEYSVLPNEKFIAATIEREKTRQTLQSDGWAAPMDIGVDLLALNGQEEYNFLRCFPFHRKVSAFATQQSRLFSLRNLVKKSVKISGCAIATGYDYATHTERTLFVLLSDKKWELYKYTATKPLLVACGRLTGEYGPLQGTLRVPADEGLVVRNDFGAADDDTSISELSLRLKQWVQLYCCLSEKYLVVAGTRGVVRVLDADVDSPDVGRPLYTYLTNFPIRCVALAPNSALLACGITAKERHLGKQQPFVILHQLETGEDGALAAEPITITVPYRDPLKLLAFNGSSTHLLCCTVYEMRYFLIRLRDPATADYRRPRLIWSDMRVNRKPRTASESSDAIEDFLGGQDDDQMLDNEGITDIKFGRAYSNTLVVTSLLLKNRPSIVLKLSGPTIDTRPKAPRLDFYDVTLHVSAASPNEESDHAATYTLEVTMKVPEIGSSIYRVEVSPRGDGMVFVDKLGRLLLVSTLNVPLGATLATTRKSVVLLGEVADALRSTEAAAVKFSSDGGKVFAVDRKGLFQVFDFTKGIPGEDPDVIKCKIISV